MSDLTPVNRIENFLAKGGDSGLTPITRHERILAGEDIEPVTRIEHFMKEAASGGGGSGLPDYTVSDLDKVLKIAADDTETIAIVPEQTVRNARMEIELSNTQPDYFVVGASCVLTENGTPHNVTVVDDPDFGPYISGDNVYIRKDDGKLYIWANDMNEYTVSVTKNVVTSVAPAWERNQLIVNINEDTHTADKTAREIYAAMPNVVFIVTDGGAHVCPLIEAWARSNGSYQFFVCNWGAFYNFTAATLDDYPVGEY